MLRTFFQALRQGCTGHVPPERRLHPDFLCHDANGWYLNRRLQKINCEYFQERTMKMRLHFRADQMRNLDSCPFPAKLGRAPQDSGFEYCLFIYAEGGAVDMMQIQRWVQTRQFSNKLVLMLGHTEGDWGAHLQPQELDNIRFRM